MSAAAAVAVAEDRLRVRVRGAVQGVGFRPFVYGLAERYGLSGFVLNDGDGVLAEVEGSALDGFLSALRRDSPALARIDTVDVIHVPREGCAGFSIRESVATGANRTRGVPDAAPCASCLDELFDPASRFHLYPFVTCTDCGPRFTVTRRLPYDRANTTMADFPLCPACAADYQAPASRRFHAETLACPTCGPRLSHPIAQVAAVLRFGGIVALKGVGGYQLICDATNEAAVQRLRERKRRPAKPFAVMIANAASLDPYARPNAAELDLLRLSARPIVLIPKGSGLAASVAPGLDQIGIMLPSAPVHHLLFHALIGQPHGSAWRDETVAFALIATSANIAGEPLVIDNAEAVRDLASIADLIVSHDRAIHARVDDTVMNVIDGAPAFIRRARGFAPEPIDLGEDGPVVLALGAHRKSTVCVTRGREAFFSPHIGDLDSPATLRSFAEAVQRLLQSLGVTPEFVACDLHPDYRATRFADAFGPPVMRVQHHAAHLAAVAAEHRLRGPLIGVALDGHGHGDDGGAWGGELMVSDEAGQWRRTGHLRPLALPGGDRAAREPWRMGVAALAALDRADEALRRFAHEPLAGRVAALLAVDGDVATTSSLGRLFDAAAALLGVCERQDYEGQAAMQLEALCGAPVSLRGGYVIQDGVLDFRPLLGALLEPGLTSVHGAALFHGTLIDGLGEWAARSAAATHGVDVVLGGGCLMNRVLADGLADALRSRGLVPWLPRAAPANDGGVALGQAAVARAKLADSRSQRSRTGL